MGNGKRKKWEKLEVRNEKRYEIKYSAFPLKVRGLFS